MRRIVVFPDPLGPRRPRTSPALTVKETPSRARRAPYHLVSCSATRTSGMRRKVRRPARRGGQPALARQSGATTWRLLQEVRRVLHGLERVRVVRREEVGVLAGLHLTDEVVGAQDALGTVGQGDVGQRIFLD